MKLIPPALLAALQAESASIFTLWKVTRTDGKIFRFTDCDQNILWLGNEYKSAVGFDRSALEKDSEGLADSARITGLIDSDSISINDLRARLFDYAEMEVRLVDFDNLALGESILLGVGGLGEVKEQGNDRFDVEFRGLSSALNRVRVRAYSKTCIRDLGDSGCGIPIKPSQRVNSSRYDAGTYVVVPTAIGVGQEQFENVMYLCTVGGITDIAQPVFDTTIGAQTIDGGVTWVAETSWTRHAIVTAVTDNKNFEIDVSEARAINGDWFNFGTVTFESGDNLGTLPADVKDWRHVLREVELFAGMPFEVSVGDKIRISPGCNKRFIIACNDRFNNVENFFGFPWIPGPDWQATIPKPSS